MKPIKEKLGKMLLWNDNCGSHKTRTVRDVIDEIGIDVAYLPRNMTSELQVLDLVVNGPRKAHIRTNRANRLYNSFQVFKKKTTRFQQLKEKMLNLIHPDLHSTKELLTYSDCSDNSFRSKNSKIVLIGLSSRLGLCRCRKTMILRHQNLNHMSRRKSVERCR